MIIGKTTLHSVILTKDVQNNKYIFKANHR